MITLQDELTGFTVSFHQEGLTIIAPGTEDSTNARTLILSTDEAMTLIDQVNMFQRCMASPSQQLMESFKWLFHQNEDPF